MFFKKKDNDVKLKCSCGTQCGIADINNARFIVLGACCKKSADMLANTKQAVINLGYPDEVLNIGDNMIIAKYGVMSTPALVINSKVVTMGKLLSVEQIMELIKEKL